MTGADSQLIIDALEDLSDWRMGDETAWQQVAAALEGLQGALESRDGEARTRAYLALVDLAPRRARAQPGPLGITPDVREQRNHLIHELTADPTPAATENAAPADAADDPRPDSR